MYTPIDPRPFIRWRKQGGRWIAERIRWDKNQVIEELGSISEKEYFRLKLADELSDELHRLWRAKLLESGISITDVKS